MLNGGGQVTVPPQHQQQIGAQRRERHPAEVRVSVIFYSYLNNGIKNIVNCR